jgi:hypothetical protein
MREVTGGNTLHDLGVGVGDVVYFNDPQFDKRGDDLTIIEVDEYGYLTEQGRVADDVPYWHVVSYDERLSDDNINTINTAGVQGYSSPTPDHVIFSMSDVVYDVVCTSQAWSDLVSEHMTVGYGSWNGQQELSLCLPKPVFDEMYRRWPFLLHDQEAVLQLGTPEAQNWRPAVLVYLKSGETEFIGTWLEVTAATARAQESWSSYNGRYYAVLAYPPEDAETSKELLVEAKLKLLNSVMSRICAIPKDVMQKYDLYHDWSTWATMDKTP